MMVMRLNVRLYDGDEIKCKIIFQYLKAYKTSSDTHIYDEFVRTLSEGNLDEYIMGFIEFLKVEVVLTWTLTLNLI